MSKFYKNLQMELSAKLNWEFTDRIKQEIWQEDEDDELRKESYKNNENVVWGWQLEAEPIFKAFEKVQREHTFDYLDSYYIQLRFAYNYWKQYEHEWNLKYKDYIK
jgi:hypothetical protein